MNKQIISTAIKNQVVDFYDYSQRYVEHREADLDIIKVLINNAKFNKEMKILDFGCGTGDYLQELQLRGFNYLHGLEPSDEMRKIAMTKTGVEISNGTHFNTQYGDNFFDAVYIINVIQFIEELDILFKELSRVCKMGGVVFLVTKSREQIKRRFYNKYFPSLNSIDMKRYHDLPFVRETAVKNGFTVDFIQNHLCDTEIIIDDKYFDAMLNKGYSHFRYLKDDEFEAGISEFKKDIECGNLKVMAAGLTIIVFKKE